MAGRALHRPTSGYCRARQRNRPGLRPSRRLDLYSGAARCPGVLLAPLKNLKPRGARVISRGFHHMDGFKYRIAMARKFLPDFGVAGYCGFGRVPPAELPAVLKEHLQAIKAAG